MQIIQKFPPTQLGIAKRHDDWDELSNISAIGRSTLEAIPNYKLVKAATCAHASPQARLLLVHLIGYLPVDKIDDPKTRFVVFPGNDRLADELSYSKRSIQRLADELEDKGFLRRCYNGLNRRTGFDITPLAMRHEEIRVRLIEVQTQRKIDRELQQLELSLAGAQIFRPTFEPSSVKSTVSDLSPQDVKSDTHNRPNYQNSSALENLAPLFSEIFDKAKSSLFDALDLNDKFGLDDEPVLEAKILNLLTGSKSAAHLGWSVAKRYLGFAGALSLVAIAEGDPRRKSSTDRYFSWLLRMAKTQEGHQIIKDAATRLSKKPLPNAARSSSVPSLTPLSKAPTSVGAALGNVFGTALGNVAPQCDRAEISSQGAVAGEDRSMQFWRQAIRDAMEPAAYNAWMHRTRLTKANCSIILTSETPFVSRYIADNFEGTILAAIQTAANSQDISLEYRVAKK